MMTKLVSDKITIDQKNYVDFKDLTGFGLAPRESTKTKPFLKSSQSEFSTPFHNIGHEIIHKL